MAAYPLPETPWGPSLGIYFILIGLASGASLVSWWARQNRDDTLRLEWVLDWIAIGALTVALALLVVDLGRPMRFFLMLTEFSNMGSPMSVAAKVVALEFSLLATSLYFLHQQRQARAAGRMGIAAGPTQWTLGAVSALLGMTSIFLAIYPVILLSRTWTSPLANNAGSGIVFLATAGLMGVALARIVAVLFPDAVGERQTAELGRTLVVLICVEALVLSLAALTLGGQPGVTGAVHALTHGIGRTAFWGLVVVVGLVAPLFGTLSLRGPRIAPFTAAVTAIVGAGATRYLLFAAH